MIDNTFHWILFKLNAICIACRFHPFDVFHILHYMIMLKLYFLFVVVIDRDKFQLWLQVKSTLLHFHFAASGYQNVALL